MNDLELIPTSDLIDELERRHDHGAIGLICETNSDETAFACQTFGNSLIVAGLCQQMSQKVLNDIDIIPGDIEEDAEFEDEED